MAKKNKTDSPYDGPALIEANLPGYDKAELAAERKLRADVQACKDAAKAAQAEIGKLETEKKGLDKNAPDFKKAAKEIDAKMKALYGVAKKKCRLQHPGCVPSDKSARVMMPKTITDDMNNRYKTNVDFGRLSAWEGGAFTKGYIPWWPYMDAKEEPKIMAMADSTGKIGPGIKGDLQGQPKNKSGTTVGIGVDLGQYDERGFFAVLDSNNNGEAKLSAEELAALKQKVKPYFKKQGGEACKYLQEHPLSLTEKEVNFLNKASHEEALGSAIGKYEDYAKRNSKSLNAAKEFRNLTREQQTAVIANIYQYGKGSPVMQKMIEAIVTGDRKKIPDTREHDYLFNSMSEPKE